MLELRPCCEHCARALPPESTEAMICTFECTFCTTCVAGPLGGVCPNCGGNFEKRPIRPARDLKNGVFLGNYPAGTKKLHRPVDLEAHAKLIERVQAG